MLISTLILGSAVAALGQAGSATDPQTFLRVLESLQSPIGDFRGEYEGVATLLNDANKAAMKVGADGISDTFSGVFVWKTGGDFFLDSFHRRPPEQRVIREQMIVRGVEAEQHVRLDDGEFGKAYVQSSYAVNADRQGSPGRIFPIDTIRRCFDRPDLVASVEQVDEGGERTAILTFRWKATGKLNWRCWLDMKRGGQCRLREGYGSEEKLVFRSMIQLKEVKAGSSRIWMPVMAVTQNFAALRDKTVVVLDKPTETETIYFVEATLEFNKHPPDSTFRAKYKPGTPVTDQLRQIQYEFGRQKMVVRTRAEVEAQLRDQLAKAEAQKTELRAGPADQGFDWSGSLVWIFGAASLITATLVLLARRR